MLIIFLAALSASGANPSPPATACNSGTATRTVMEVESLPSSLQTELGRYVKNLAPRDADFQRGDLVVNENLPTRRLVAAYANGKVWVIVYENGIVGNLHALTFRPQKRAEAADVEFKIVPNAHLVGPLCDIVQASFANVRAPG